jgi:hypothetical protein
VVIASALDELTLKTQVLKNRQQKMADEKVSLVLSKPINVNTKFITTNNSVRDSLEVG